MTAPAAAHHPVVLHDGTPAYLRALEARDRLALRDGFAALSAESKHRRFLSSVTDLSDGMLRLLVDGVDGVDHVAVGLVVVTDAGEEIPVGVARLVRYAADPAAADLAATVADDWQGRGVATAMVRHLIERRAPDIRRIRTLVVAENAPSLALLRRLGPTTTRPGGPGVLEVEVELAERVSR